MFLLPVLAGILSWISFPKLNQGYAAWFALIPLVGFVALVRSPGRAFLGGAVTGAVQFLLLLYWIPNVLSRYGGLPVIASWALFVPMLAVLGCYPGAVCALTRYCMNRGGSAYLLVFAPAWVVFEFVRGVFPFGGFPWLLTGYSQTDYLRIAQIADITGVYGVSLLVVWVNVALVHMFTERARGRFRYAPAVAGLIVLSGTLVYGELALRKWDRIQPLFRTAMLQGNLSIDEPDSALAWKYQQGYAAMADGIAAQNVDLLILPEAPSPVIYQDDAPYRDKMQNLARRFRLGMVFNNICFHAADGGDHYFNCSYYLDRNGSEAGRYDKIHLVPFGEYIPLQKLFFFSEIISKDVGNFHPGAEYSTFMLSGHRTNTIICFEAVFPELARQFVSRQGSELMINLTNDGWYGDTSAPYQHLAMARWRAIENRRYLLRAANTGISATVAPTGRVTGTTGILRQDVAIGAFAFLQSPTFYSRHGSMVVILCAIITPLAVVGSRFRRTRPQRYHDSMEA